MKTKLKLKSKLKDYDLAHQHFNTLTQQCTVTLALYCFNALKHQQFNDVRRQHFNAVKRLKFCHCIFYAKLGALQSSPRRASIILLGAVQGGVLSFKAVPIGESTDIHTEFFSDKNRGGMFQDFFKIFLRKSFCLVNFLSKSILNFESRSFVSKYIFGRYHPIWPHYYIFFIY